MASEPFRDLLALVQELGPLLAPMAQRVARSVLRTLREVRARFKRAPAPTRQMHEDGFCCRDISLESVKIRSLDPFEVALEGDARLSTPIVSQSGVPLAVRGQVGRRRTLAPEVMQAVDAAYNGARADMWSVGVLLFELLTGFSPLRQATDADAAFRALVQTQGYGRSGVRALFEAFSLSPKISDHCIALLDSLLALDPHVRPLAAEALMSPWFLEDDPAAEREDAARLAAAQREWDLKRASAE